jgi:hypothetical protein
MPKITPKVSESLGLTPRSVVQDVPVEQTTAVVEPTPVQPVVVTPDTGSSGTLLVGVVLGAGAVAVASAFINKKK